jgi:ribosomal protein S18 acetylase RimI-like enzyme
LEIVRLNPGLREPFAAFLREISLSGDARFFHPHPFDSAAAERICAYEGEDLYYVAKVGDRVVAYGLLRGWDERYEVPSLGIRVGHDLRSEGMGELMMRFLHVAARARGATLVRLKVHPLNLHARRLYERLGYRFDGFDGAEEIGVVSLESGSLGGPIHPDG